VVLDQMSSRGIAIYSVGCQPALSQYQFGEAFFVAAAQRTNGQAVALESAGALADVIIGASVEEMVLQSLTHQVQHMTTAFRSLQPSLTDSEVEQRVYEQLSSDGTKTQQMGGARLNSAHAGLVSAAPSLMCAKEALSSVVPTRVPRAPDGTEYRGLSSSAKLHYRSLGCAGATDLDDDDSDEEAWDEDEYTPLARRLAPPAPAPVPKPVALSEDVISMDQVQRLMRRGKKQGLW